MPTDDARIASALLLCASGFDATARALERIWPSVDLAARQQIQEQIVVLRQYAAMIAGNVEPVYRGAVGRAQRASDLLPDEAYPPEDAEPPRR